MIYLRQHSYYLLLALFVFLFLFIPLIESIDLIGLITRLMFTAILLMSIYIVLHTTSSLVIAIILILPNIIISWTALFDESVMAQTIKYSTTILFYLYITTILIRHIFSQTKVDTNIIAGAICIYLLMGLIWSLSYTLIEIYNPGSFQGMPTFPVDFNIADMLEHKMRVLFYYSFITLTTLGYGNISPATVMASAISSSEAIVGQIYLTVLVARLVGMHITQHVSK